MATEATKQRSEPAKRHLSQQKTITNVIPGGAVVYVGRIPHGFYEEEMKEYFGQFGEITRLRLSRNKTTGASRHYAFIEFRYSAVAQIVAETMNNYLLFNQLLQCHIIPEDKVHLECFKGTDRKFRVIPWRSIARKQYNNRKTEGLKEKEGVRKKRLEERIAKQGIQYDLDQVVTL